MLRIMHRKRECDQISQEIIGGDKLKPCVALQMLPDPTMPQPEALMQDRRQGQRPFRRQPCCRNDTEKPAQG